MLAGRGFKEVYSLAGGIKAWKGGVARGPEQEGLGLITGDETLAGLLAVVFSLEKGLGEFYQAAAGMVADEQAAQLMNKLARVEETHVAKVLEMFKTAEPAPEDRQALEAVKGDVTEGGFSVEDLGKSLQQSDMSPAELVDWAMALEAQAMDLYLRMAKRSTDPAATEALTHLGNDEKAHMESLARLRDQYAAD
jgi:rubrerythrin